SAAGSRSRCRSSAQDPRPRLTRTARRTRGPRTDEDVERRWPSLSLQMIDEAPTYLGDQRGSNGGVCAIHSRGNMEGSLPERFPAWLRRASWRVGDAAWNAEWRALRAAATPWVRGQYRAARAVLVGEPPSAATIDRDALDGWLRSAAPPEVPFETAVLPGAE